MASIVIDGAHFLSKTATGIGTYARTVASTLTECGCRVGVLYGKPMEVGSGNPLSLAAQVFGNEPPTARRTRLLREARFLLRAMAGGGSRSRAIDIPREGVELASFEPALPPCDQVLNADAIYERAHRLFAMKERFVEVDVPGAWNAAHWTAPMTLKARRMPNIYTIHDLIPLQFPHFVIDVAGRAARLHAAVARDADHIVTDSEASKRHIVELLRVPEERVSVTYLPVPRLPEIPREDAERLVQAVYGVKAGSYALYAGAIEPRKNLKRLVEAALLACSDVPLLIAGPLGWLYDDDVALMDRIAAQWRPEGEQPPVRRLGYLPRHHLVALIQCARFFAFPSIHEGFGLPVLEAMQLGVPVLTSSTSSLPEVAGDAAVLVDPLNLASITREFRRLSHDDDLRAELARRGPARAALFSRESFQEQLAASYRKVGVELGGHAAHCLTSLSPAKKPRHQEAAAVC